MNIVNCLLIIVQVTINSAAQILLKKGIGVVNFGQPIFSLLFSIITNWHILGGTTIFVVSLFTWLYLLSQFDLSFLYPIGSLAFVITAFYGYLFLGEIITWSRGVGIFLILLGVTFIAKN